MRANEREFSPPDMLEYLKSRGCRIGGVSMGERGLVWYDETGLAREQPALAVPSARVIDTSGAGDVLHGAYIYSYLAHPGWKWNVAQFEFAQAASAYKFSISAMKQDCPRLQTSRR